MTDRKHSPGATAAAAPSSFRPLPSAHAQAFAEAQSRLAARRRARAAAEAEARVRAAAAAAAQRAASTASLRVRLGLGGGSDNGPPALVRRLGDSVLGAWDGVSRLAAGWGVHNDAVSGGDIPAFRVSQVDAELLDEELLDLLRTQVGDALRYVRDGAVAEDWAAEIQLVLRAALFKLSVWDHDATYGASLQNLRYADARTPRRVSGSDGASMAAVVPVPPAAWQKALYGVVTVGGRYAWTKWEDWLRDHGDEADDEAEEQEDDDSDDNDRQRQTPRIRVLGMPVALPWRLPRGRLPRPSPQAIRRLGRATTVVSDVYAGAAFVSFLLFLRYGRYRTLLDRVLRMRLVPPTSQVHREVSFEYLNRQLVWHAFTEFLLFLLPLVGVQRWRRWLARTWRKTKGAVSTVVGGRGGDGSKDVAVPATGELAFLPERTCAICYEDQTAATTSEADVMAQAAASSGVIGSAETDVTNPYEAIPCGCVYCYVCLATRIEREEGDGWTCLRCRAVVHVCRPWNGDVLEPAAERAAAASADADDTKASRSRPSSSSTTASGGPAHKTVGFADDVKGEDEEETTDDGIAMNEVDEEEGCVEENSASDGVDSDSASEAYEEDEEGSALDEDLEE